MIEIYRAVVASSLASLAMYYDLKTYKIPNKLLLVFLLFIPPLLIIEHKSYVNTLAGFFIPFLLGYPVYKIKGIGAGDVKEMCVIGAFVGLTRIFTFLWITCVYGGLIGIIKLIYVYKFGKYDVTSGTRFHFGVAIFCSTLTIFIGRR